MAGLPTSSLRLAYVHGMFTLKTSPERWDLPAFGLYTQTRHTVVSFLRGVSRSVPARNYGYQGDAELGPPLPVIWLREC